MMLSKFLRGTLMHPESGDAQMVTLGERESTDKPARRMSERYSGGEPKLCFGLVWLRSPKLRLKT